MPLTVLIALVVGGISAIALLTRWLGVPPRRFDDARTARAAWSREFPQTPPYAVTLCRSGTAALVDTVDGPGIVWAMGADSTARLLTGAELQHRGDTLIVTLPDYTAPRIALRLTADEARSWAGAIKRTP